MNGKDLVFSKEKMPYWLVFEKYEDSCKLAGITHNQSISDIMDDTGIKKHMAEIV